MMNLVLIVALAALVAFLVLGGVVLVLVKLGVIAHYALKVEHPQEGEYGLDQSRQAGRD